MDNDVAGVDQHPVAMVQALNGNALEAFSFQTSLDVIRHGAHVALRGSRRNDQEIGNGGLTGKIDHDGVLGLVVVEGCFHQLQNFVHRRHRHGLGYGCTPLGCCPWSVSGPAYGPCRPRIFVAETGLRGRLNNTQAGARRFASPAARNGLMR